MFDKEKCREAANIQKKDCTRIQGSKEIGEGEYRKILNYKIEDILENEDIRVKIIKAQRIRWRRYVSRREEG